jgi:uracil-DNA glycosylase
MNHPVNKQTFAELTRLRDRMDLENPDSAHVGIAKPFVPWIGRDILEGFPGIYFVGRATSGSCDGIKDFQTAVEFAEECSLEISTPFWQYIKAVTEKVYEEQYSKCVARIAWSNQMKIGVFNRTGPKNLTPTGWYEEIQLQTCESIMRRELQFASACALVFLGDGPLFYPLLGRDGWEKEQYKEQGIWQKRRQNMAPVFCQSHPGWLRRQGGDLFHENARVLTCAIREWLGKRRLALGATT